MDILCISRKTATSKLAVYYYLVFLTPVTCLLLVFVAQRDVGISSLSFDDVISLMMFSFSFDVIIFL